MGLVVGHLADPTRCRVCGWGHGYAPWGDGADPDFSICPCCGVEAGHEDVDLEGVRRYRARWLERGAPWFERRERPAGWDLETQLGEVVAPWL